MSSIETRVSKCRVSKLEYRNVEYRKVEIRKSRINKVSDATYISDVVFRPALHVFRKNVNKYLNNIYIVSLLNTAMYTHHWFIEEK